MNLIAMSKSAMIRARVEPELKEEGEAVLKQLGLSTSEFISMTFRQLVMRQGLPFDARIPNDETIAAINKDLSEMPTYTNARSMTEEILSESD
jgi:DNA-damage-inducible protein J